MVRADNVSRHKFGTAIPSAAPQGLSYHAIVNRLHGRSNQSITWYTINIHMVYGNVNKINMLCKFEYILELGLYLMPVEVHESRVYRDTTV